MSHPENTPHHDLNNKAMLTSASSTTGATGGTWNYFRL